MADDAGIDFMLPIARWLWKYLDMISAYRELVERYQMLKRNVEQDRRLELLLLWALLGCSRGQRRLGDYDAARSEASRALALARALGDRPGIATALEHLGNVEHIQGNYQKAGELHAESLAIEREAGDRGGIATALNNLGIVERRQGD